MGAVDQTALGDDVDDKESDGRGYDMPGDDDDGDAVAEVQVERSVEEEEDVPRQLGGGQAVYVDVSRHLEQKVPCVDTRTAGKRRSGRRPASGKAAFRAGRRLARGEQVE